MTLLSTPEFPKLLGPDLSHSALARVESKGAENVTEHGQHAFTALPLTLQQPCTYRSSCRLQIDQEGDQEQPAQAANDEVMKSQDNFSNHLHGPRSPTGGMVRSGTPVPSLARPATR